MKTSKEGCTTASEPSPECCMCGDCGLSDELFRCKVCQYRSQHRYCSNLYPKAESYGTCNWCLNQKDDTKAKAQNSSNSSSSCRNTSEDEMKINKKRSDHGGSANHASPKEKIKGSSLKLQVVNNTIKKPRSPELSPASGSRKRVTVVAGIEKRLRRTRSEEILNKGITKPVMRNRVRRYKLLEEVSS